MQGNVGFAYVSRKLLLDIVQTGRNMRNSGELPGSGKNAKLLRAEVIGRFPSFPRLLLQDLMEGRGETEDISSCGTSRGQEKAPTVKSIQTLLHYGANGSGKMHIP